MREIVIPGEQLSDHKVKIGNGAYLRNGKAYASIYGISKKDKDFVKVVPLTGKYTPRERDQVIGIVRHVRFRACFVDLNSPYDGYLSLEDETEYPVGTIVMAEVVDVSDSNKVTLDNPRKLYDGKLIEVQPVKIPRVVGRHGSMINMIRNHTSGYVFVGRNGRIFIKGERQDIQKVEEALRMIEKQAHTHGLTARVKEFLEGGGKK
jgi:exosome complex component RRP4